MPKLQRETLYQDVWSRPCSRIASDLGISGSAFKQICIRMDVPTPSSGYWTQVQYGKKTEIKHLPKATESTLLEWDLETEREIKHVATDNRRKVGKPREEPKAKSPPDDPEKLHPLVSATRDQFLEDLRSIPWDQRRIRKHFRIGVSKGSLDRSLLFLNAFARAVEAHGFKFVSELDNQNSASHQPRSNPRDDHRPSPYCWISVSGEPVHFWLREPNRRVKIEDPEERRLAFREWEEGPSGILEFSFDPGWGFQHTSLWKDRKLSRIEDRLDEIIAAIPLVGDFIKRERIRREEQRLLYQNLEALRRNLGYQRRIEDEAVEELLKQAHDFRQAADLRAYVEAVCARLESDGRSPSQETAPEDLWIRWALARAEMLDPLRRGHLPWDEHHFRNLSI